MSDEWEDKKSAAAREWLLSVKPELWEIGGTAFRDGADWAREYGSPMYHAWDGQLLAERDEFKNRYNELCAIGGVIAKSEYDALKAERDELRAKLLEIAEDVERRYREGTYEYQYALLARAALEDSK